MRQKLVGLVLLASIGGCMSMPGGEPQDPPAPPDAPPPPPPDAAPAPPDAAPLIETSCVTTVTQANQRWYGCSTLELWDTCDMDTLYNQQADGGERCFDCHQSADGAGGVMLSDNSEATYLFYRNTPGMWKLAIPVSSGAGYEGLEMNDIMIRKGNIGNDSHPNYDFNDARLAALDCYMGQMVAMFADCQNPCANP